MQPEAKPSETPVFSVTPLATPIPSATSTPTPTNTSTVTATPTSLLLVEAGTPLPALHPPLTLENAPNASGLAEWQLAPIVDLAWLPGGQFLAIANSTGINLVDIPSQRNVRSLYPQREGLITIAISPSANWLVSGSRKSYEGGGYASSLELWRGPDWQPLGILYNVSRGVSDLAFSPSGNTLAVAYTGLIQEQNGIDLWNVQTWTITGTIPAAPALSLAFSPITETLALSPDQYALRIWGLSQGDWIFTAHTSFTGAVNSLVFSPDGLTLASGHYDGVIRLWDAYSGELLLTIQTDEVIESLAFSPDGRILASGGSYANHYIRLWESSTGKLLRTLEGHSAGVRHLTFSPQSQYLISASYDGNLRIWGIRP